jgi:50S ribosomal protein 6
MAVMIGAPVRLVVRAATHVNPKATKGHTKTRPKKVRLLRIDPQNPET